MKARIRKILFGSLFTCLLSFAGPVGSQVPAPEQGVEAPTRKPAEASDATQPSTAEESVERTDDAPDTHVRRTRRAAIVRFGTDAHLPADESAESVIALMASSISEGEVSDAVIAVFGNTRVTGAVGHDVGAVFGDTYVDAEIGGDIFAAFGDVELGPNAIVSGDVLSVGGRINRDPRAIVSGKLQEIEIAGKFGRLEWLRPWIKHCLLLARPLAIEPGLGWAWAIALGFLAFYVLIAVMFSDAVEACVRTVEKQPGQSVLAALLTVLATPALFLLLTITVLGIILIPFVGAALFFAGFFGKAVILAALGRRITRFAEVGPLAHIAFAVLVGGALVLGLYLIPVLGFIIYKTLGILGLGVVVYTLLLAIRDRRPTPALAAATPGAAPYVPPLATASSAGSAFSDTSGPAPANAPSQDTVAVTALPRASFWIRMVALFIDLVLIAFVVAASEVAQLMIFGLAAYGAVMWKLRGTTVGGIICNLQVVRLDGREIDWPTAIVRSLGCFVSLAVAGIGFFWILIDDGRQAWHDKLAGTIVVRTPKGRSLV